MLGHLIRKEMLDHILSLRFLILSAIGALVIWLSLFSGYTYYQGRVRDYRMAQVAAEDRIRQMVDAGKLGVTPAWKEIGEITYMIHKPPTPMSIFVRGLAPSLGRSVPVSEAANNRRVKLSPVATVPILGVFPPLDLGLVVQVVLSLFVLLFTYDAVCGEKEAGTLRLVGSFSASRDRLLLAKFAGALVPTLAAFGLPLVLGGGVVLLMPGVQFTDPELMRLGLILVAFGLYLAVFTCVGLFASCLVHRAATSFVLLLTFWVVTTAVAPRLSLIVADGFRPAPSVHEFQAERSRITREKHEKDRALRRQWREAHPNFRETPDGREARHLNYREVVNKVEKMFGPQFDRLDEAFRNRYTARSELAVTLARFSPAFALKNATVRLAGTGLDRHRRFESAGDQHTDRDRAWLWKTFFLDVLRRTKPEKYGEHRWDLSDMPRFMYREVWPGEDVRSALVDVGILALWGLVFFVGAYVGMLRYDVR